MSDKPLKTVDNILAILAWKGKYTDSGQEVVDAGEVERAKADLYQLMLSLVPKKESKDFDEIEKMSVGDKYVYLKHQVYSQADLEDSYDEAIDDLRQKLSEHFNGEGEV